MGATSIRVALVDLDAVVPAVEVLHRWRNDPVRHDDGSLRWDWDRIIAEVELGLAKGVTRGPVASIGVDGWGVDYGLLDEKGRLLSPPFSYRDARTEGWGVTMERIGAERLYGITGIQLMPINTIFQVGAHDPRELARASRLMLLPDLLVRALTGMEGTERSNASTTGLLDVRSGSWSDELLQAVGLDAAVVPPIVSSARPAGTWQGIPVHTVGSHDTASAFVAVPGVPGPRTAVVSSGTWVLVGAERVHPDTSAMARVANFSNEAGALGGIRFLKNVMGFWMLERCRAQWNDPPLDALVSAATVVEEPVPVVDAMDPRFLAPADMEAEVRAAASLAASATRADVIRCLLESIAAATADVVNELGTVTGTAIAELLVVGGGARIRFMNELYARHTGLSVTVGSPEAAALGNAVVQGIALGRFEDIDDARGWLAAGGERV
jgi:rhamnulokinase